MSSLSKTARLISGVTRVLMKAILAPPVWLSYDPRPLPLAPQITRPWQPWVGDFLFRRSGHPQRDLGDALADSADGTEAAFIL
jgi:hypothetical protein